MTYVLLTPIKDEVDNLPKLKETILKQIQKPVLYVIVDSGSSDGSFEKAKDLFKEFPWVHFIHQETFFEKSYGHKNFAQAINEGYSYLKKFAERNKVDYSYVGKTDATPVLSDDYFKVLQEALSEYPSLNLVCGVERCLEKEGKDFVNSFRINEIKTTGFNDIRLYKKEFFEEMNCYPLTFSPDTVLLVKALNRNSAKIIEQTYFIEPRMGGSKIGKWKGGNLKGAAMYYLGYGSVRAFFNSAFVFLSFPPNYLGAAMFYGYSRSVIKKTERTEDPEILDYFKDKNFLLEVYSLIKNKFR